jgi:hypothetical protein
MKALKVRKIENLVIDLHVTREFRLRVWLATQLVRLAAWTLGGRCNVSADFNDESS